MAFNWFLIIVAVVISVVVLAGVGMLIVYFGHPDDSNTAWFPKFVVLFALYTAAATVLLLPLDVASGQTGGGLNMQIAWDIAVWVIAVLLFAIIPFAYFFYENDNDPSDDTRGCCGLVPGWNTQFCEGLKWSIGFIIIFTLVLVLMWVFLRWADIPVRNRTYNWLDDELRVSAAYDSFDSSLLARMSCDRSSACNSKMLDIEIEVTIGIFCMALLSFAGWFLFVVFAGLGLVLLPLDLFYEWKNRPKPIDLATYATEKKKLGDRASLLKEAGHRIKNDELAGLGTRLSRSDRKEKAETFHRFENAVYMLKRDYIHLETAYALRGGNPFFAWVKLLVSIVGASMSLMWIIHVCIFVLPSRPLHPFLNSLFIGLTVPGFPLFGVSAFAFYSFWLFLAVLKGNFRFGLRFAFCRVFPMEVNNTLVNSFLANAWLICLCSFVVVQFCAISFPVYARNTSVDLIFGTQIRYLRFFTYFFDNNIFLYVFLAFFGLGCIWQIICPRNDAKRIENELKDIMRSKTDFKKRDIELAGKN